MNRRIALAGPSELHFVHSIMAEAFAEYRGPLHPPSGANRETLADVERAAASGGAVLAWDGSTAVGSARFQVRPDHVYAERVAVLPAHRRKGIASGMMRFFEEEALRLGRKEVVVGVRMALPGNQALYEGLGYRVARIEPHQAGDGSQMVVWMVREVFTPSGEVSPPSPR